MKRLLFTILSFLYIFFIHNTSFIYADNIVLNDDMHAIEINDCISIYHNNILIKVIKNSTILDFNSNNLLYNNNDKVYLYNVKHDNTKLISNDAYNALIYKETIIYESDKNDNLICKNVIESIQYRNCYKLYSYNINKNEHTLIELSGNDIYLNDIENDYLVYTSIHNKDSVCHSLCSYVNLYDLESKENLILNNYSELILDMSGNGFLYDDKVIFESIPSIYGCQYIQIFVYDIEKNNFEIITKNDNMCFTDNSEIVSLSDGYIIFRTNYNNYEDNNFKNYVYSIDDYKYRSINNICGNQNVVTNDENNIYCLNNNEILIHKIDESAPSINTNKQYVSLRENVSKLIDNLEYYDDLSSKENIKVSLLNNLSDVGLKNVKIELCDKYNNCSINTILVDIIDVDITPPKIYCNELITIKSNQHLDISKYGFALDNVDGRLTIEIEGEVDYSKSGEYVLLIKSIDSSGNIGYKEIELIIYNNISISYIYFILISVSIILVVIIYILRFKNKEHF